MFIVPFVFKANITKGERINISGKKDSFNISHIGSLYPNRDSADFLKALNMLLGQHPELKDCIELNYVGNVTSNDRELVKQYNLSSITNFAGVLSEEECQGYFERADLFLAIDGKNSRNIFFPSKIMKYFYYGKAILGLTPKDSALQYELDKSGNFCFENEDYQGVANFLFQAITKEGFLEVFDRSYWRNYTMECVCPQYLCIINELIGK